ncbi:hypothetical protein BSN85_16400 [Bradyrhizobium brasilense]|uniref:hypothetical protein n=1 Tax=Bradyrhizobium brasilense TaxID=1419277 RepID=UPI0009765B15|nr:hypothetical protein [Bradyrhizobium brasilense]OMI09507.1 hypothetical protein BSN85_16400 [Bradyrhizobium brasilense]
MISLHDILRHMQDTCDRISRPRTGGNNQPMIVMRGVLIPVEADGPPKPFEPWVVEAFRGLKHASETGEPFALINCLKDGKPCSVIVTTEDGGDRMAFTPLFIAVTDDMQFQPYPLDQKAA